MQVRNSMHILKKNKSNYLYKTEIQTKCYLNQEGVYKFYESFNKILCCIKLVR